MNLRAGLVLLIATSAGAYVLVAQEKGNTTNFEAKTVFVGQPLEEAKKLLQSQGMQFGEGGFSFAMIDPDQSNLYVTLDPNHAIACAFYSKSKSKITELRVAFFPSRKQRSKSGEAWLSAEEIIFNPGRSYSIKFSPPITEEELLRLESELPKNQLPQNPSHR